MVNKFLIGAVGLAILGGVAFAEDKAAVPAAPAAQTAQDPEAMGDQGQDQQGWWGRARHHGGQHMGEHMGHHGMMMGDRGQGGPGPMGMMGDHQGFMLNLGNGIHVGIMCGKQALKECIADAQPLIDAAKTAAAAQAPAKAQ